jgi:hypothetical protein
MSITVSTHGRSGQYIERISRNRGMVTGTITFGSSYAEGGESISDITKYFWSTNRTAFSCITNLVVEMPGGYFAYLDNSTPGSEVVRVKQTGVPPIVYEEPATAAAKVATLEYPAAWIINVCTTGQNEALRATASTLADSQCSLTAAPSAGAQTKINTYGATDALLVTYATQSFRGLLDLLVYEEAVTLVTGNNNLANPMMAFGYCDAATTGLLLPVDTADTAAAGEVEIKFNAATAQLAINAAQNGEAAKATYLKAPTSGTWLYDHWVPDEDPTKAGSDPYTQAFKYPLAMWNITGALTVNSGVTQKIVDQGITAAAGEVNTRWGISNYELLATVGAAPVAGHVWGAKSNVTVTAGNYIKGQPWEIPTDAIEVPASDLSGLGACKFYAIGYTRT